MPNVAGVSFDYTPQGMRAAEEYRGSLSPRKRNMGFRPLGMQEGGEPIPSEEYVYPDRESRQDAINFIMETMGSTSDSMVMTLLAMRDFEVRRAELKVIRDAEAGKYDHVSRQFPAARLPSLNKTSFPNILEVPDRVPRQSQMMPQMQVPQMQVPQVPQRMPQMEKKSLPEMRGGENPWDKLPGQMPDTMRKFLEEGGRERKGFQKMEPSPGRERPSDLRPRDLRPGIAPPGGYWIKDGGYVSHESLRRRNMGFRPLGMQEGGEPISSYLLAANQELIDMTRSNATTEELAAYIQQNRTVLQHIADEYRDTRFNYLRRTLEQFPAPSPKGIPFYDAPVSEWGDLGDVFRQYASARAGDYDPQTQMQPRAGMQSFPGYEGGTGDYYPPQVEQNPTDFRNRKFSYPFAPQGMAHGGVPRGTVDGELRSRGYMTAGEAGKDMRERLYGGIGSLYTRRG
jgi:hypothetical protein